MEAACLVGLARLDDCFDRIKKAEVLPMALWVPLPGPVLASLQLHPLSVIASLLRETRTSSLILHITLSLPFPNVLSFIRVGFVRGE